MLVFGKKQKKLWGCVMKRALILGPGGLRGAYGGGVAATLGRKLGRGYFDTVYGCSAGAYTGSYLVSGQPDTIEAIWRECVHGKLLIRWHNIFRGDKPTLDLFYLNEVLRSSRYHLSVENLLNSPVKMFMVATECQSGVARYFSPKTLAEFFLQVRASAAVPYFHPSVLIDGKRYVDGGLSDPFPIERALADCHDEIVIVCNRSRLSMSRLVLLPSIIGAMSYAGRRQMLRSLAKLRKIESLLETKKSCIRLILPSSEPPMRWPLDNSKARINRLVDLGIRDALTFLA